MSQDSIDINVYETVETVDIVVTPNITEINITSVAGSQPVTKTSELENDGEDGVNPFITLEDVPPFEPTDYDLEDFNNASADPFVRVSEVTSAVDSVNGQTGVVVLDASDVGAEPILGFTPENVANKATNLTSPDNTKYPTTQAVVDGLATKFTLPALTSGSVLFSNGSTIAQDNSQLFWDDVNKRLGIGTNTPTQSLDVKAVIRAFNDNGSSNITVQTTGGVGYRDASLNLIGGSQGSNNFSWISDGLNNYFKNGISSTGSFRIRNSTNTDVFFVGFNGNVLINSTSDTTLFRLDVNGTTRLNGNTSIGGAAAGARLDVRAQGALSTDIAFRVRNSADSANLFEVRGNGNIGINTTTDAGFKLDVNGTARVQGKITQTPHTNINGNISAVGALNISLNGTISAGNGSFTVFGTSNASSNYVIGYLSSSATFNNTILIGESITSAGGQSVSIGNGSKSGISSVSIGYAAISTTNEFVSGANGNNISNVYFGSGVTRNNTNGVGSAYTINGSGAFGTDFAGGNITIAGGKGTGTGASGDVIFSTATPTTTGTTLQTLTQRWFIKGSSGILANVSTPNDSAQLQVDSTTKGFLPPRMTNAQRLAIASPAIGLIVYCTDAIEGLYVNKSSGWTFVI